MQKRYTWTVFLFSALILAFLLSGCKGRFVPMDMDDARLAWGDFEEAVYDFLIDDEKRGESVLTVERIRNNTYAIDMVINIDGGEHLVGAEVDGETFLPLSSYNRVLPPPEAESRKRETFAEYEGQNLSIIAHRDGEEQDYSIRLPHMVVDNESSLMMVRNLPLQVGYQKLLNLAIISTVQVAPYEIRVEGVETVQAPYGEIECYKVVYSYKGLGNVPDMFAWYSADEAKVMVKYINRNVTFILTSFEGS